MMGLAAMAKAVAQVDELSIVYESVGIGAPPVMLVHGAFEDRTYFAPQVTHLAHRRRVVALDLRGHGESSTPAQLTLEDFAADVIAVVHAAGLAGIVLCGHSMAGVVALKVAAAHPNLVRGIVMLDGTVLFPEAVRQAGLVNLVPALGTDRWLEALRGYFSRTLDSMDPPQLKQRVMEDLGRVRPELARTFFASLFASDYADDLTNAQCPLLYIRAKAPTDLKRLMERRPDVMVGQVVGSGHYLMQSVPDQVNAMLDRFLEVGLGTEPS
jgi:pimeloyl-ACP methyl ester carboxylesterase